MTTMQMYLAEDGETRWFDILKAEKLGESRTWDGGTGGEVEILWRSRKGTLIVQSCYTDDPDAAFEDLLKGSFEELDENPGLWFLKRNLTVPEGFQSLVNDLEG